jgi:8-oxo-dGTP diphosphatase
MSRDCAGIRTLAEIDWASWEAVDRATLLFVLEADRVLLIRKKRGLGAGKINGPGGKLDAGESWKAAAIREVEEEICITPTGVVERGELKFQFLDGYSIHVRAFSASGFRGEPAATAEAAPLWFDLDDVPYEEMWADDILWLPILFAGDNFRGRFIFDDDAMLDHAVERVS